MFNLVQSINFVVHTLHNEQEFCYLEASKLDTKSMCRDIRNTMISKHLLKIMLPTVNFMIPSIILPTATRLEEITSDFHLGFGAFNEKPLEPFTDPSQRAPLGPGGAVVSATDYSYRHFVSLTDNITQFRVSI